MIELAEGNILDGIISQLTNGKSGYTKYSNGTTLSKLMKNSEYFLS